jgi:hypothetical protein
MQDVMENLRLKKMRPIVERFLDDPQVA